MRRADQIGAVLLLLFGVAYAATAAKSYTYWGANGPGSGFFPFWLGVAMAILATLFLIGATRSPGPGEAWLPSGHGLIRLAAVVGATVLFVVLLPILGMTLATALFLLGLLRFLEGHAWPVSLGVAVVTAMGNWAIFAWWLQVPFPIGVLGF
ncbi:MAG: tripartite tricarboxylate transporter TctB family protein [Candidatus Rokuibacteriota bacterium]